MRTDPLKEVKIRKRVEQAQAEQLAGQLASARGIYEELLRDNADSPVVLHGLGVLAVQEGNVQEAESYLRRAVDVEPEVGRNWNDLGEALRHQGKGEDAVAAYQRALELEPDFVEAMNNLGVALAGFGNSDEAKRYFQNAIHADPNYAHPYNNLGVALESEGAFDEALRYYEQAVKLKPDFLEAKENYTNLLTRFPEKVVDSMARLLEEAKQL